MSEIACAKVSVQIRMPQALQRRNKTLEDQLKQSVYTSSVLATAHNDRAEKLMEAWVKDRLDREQAYQRQVAAARQSAARQAASAVHFAIRHDDFARNTDASTNTSNSPDFGETKALALRHGMSLSSCDDASASCTGLEVESDSNELDLVNEAQELISRLPEETAHSLLETLRESHTPLAQHVRHLAAFNGHPEKESVGQESRRIDKTAPALDAPVVPKIVSRKEKMTKIKSRREEREARSKTHRPSRPWEPTVISMEAIVALDDGTSQPTEITGKHPTRTQILASLLGLVLLSAACSSFQALALWLASLQVLGILGACLWWEEDQMCGRGFRIVAQMMVLLLSGSICALLMWVAVSGDIPPHFSLLGSSFAFVHLRPRISRFASELSLLASRLCCPLSLRFRRVSPAHSDLIRFTSVVR